MCLRSAAPLSRQGANIATMQLYRDRRGGLAVMVMECDDPLPDGLREELAAIDGVVRCTCLEVEEGKHVLSINRPPLLDAGGDALVAGGVGG